jgi:phosphoenolpyruvate-protein kinase (PTS system EI component)
VDLCASVSSVSGAARAKAQGAAAIGLVRSEYLTPPDGSVPDAEFYRTVLGELCSAATPLPVTLRLLDLAADKRPSWAPDLPGLTGPLGLRGARLYQWDPVRRVLDRQLQAVALLAPRFSLRLLLPYAVQIEEFAAWRSSIQADFQTQPAVGAMVETPAAVLDLPAWLAVADFVAIGCNDLMQCLFAADRDLPQLRDCLDPYAPVLHRVLREAALNAGSGASQIQLCGLLPQVQGVLPILVGLGYRTFSVDAAWIPALAGVAGRLDLESARQIAQQVCRAHSAVEARAILGIEPDRPWGLGLLPTA